MDKRLVTAMRTGKLQAIQVEICRLEIDNRARLLINGVGGFISNARNATPLDPDVQASKLDRDLEKTYTHPYEEIRKVVLAPTFSLKYILEENKACLPPAPSQTGRSSGSGKRARATGEKSDEEAGFFD